MKAFPKISIVIPSHNKVKYIQETLESIFSQNYPNLEVIIQDGGSTDGTLEIIKEFIKKYPNIINCVSNKDKGQANAINIGFKKAKGEIITYINADDIYKKGALIKVGKYFSDHPDILWMTGKGNMIDGKGKEISKYVTYYKNLLLRINRYALLLMVNYLTQPAVFLRMSAYKRHGPFSEKYGYVMEYGLWLNLGKIQMPAIIKTPLASFRLTMKNISATQFRNVLSQDYSIAKKHTRNPLIIFLHHLHNLGRTITICLIKTYN